MVFWKGLINKFSFQDISSLMDFVVSLALYVLRSSFPAFSAMVWKTNVIHRQTCADVFFIRVCWQVNCERLANFTFLTSLIHVVWKDFRPHSDALKKSRQHTEASQRCLAVLSVAVHIARTSFIMASSSSRPLSLLAKGSYISQVALANVLEAVREDPSILEEVSKGHAMSAWQTHPLVLHSRRWVWSWTMVLRKKYGISIPWQFCSTSWKRRSRSKSFSTPGWDPTQVVGTSSCTGTRWRPDRHWRKVIPEKYGLCIGASRSSMAWAYARLFFLILFVV